MAGSLCGKHRRVKWTKPNLGLVEFAGNKNNNLIKTEPGPWGFVNLKVLANPADPDPSRRYKISTHVYFRHHTRLGTLAPFTSADGLTWRLATDALPLKAELRHSLQCALCPERLTGYTLKIQTNLPPQYQSLPGRPTP